MKSMKRRGLALLLAVCLILQTISYIAPSTAAASEASATNSFELNGVNILHKQTLTDNGGGSYTLEVELDAGLVHTNNNEDSTESQNDYFTARYSGYYLIELWGGDGADGSDTDICNGGTGGQGGHVYGKVFLNAGETLYYQLGGNGSQTDVQDAGGGANGEGGGHGSIGSTKVGGGGGYSAIYKFNAAEFEQNYTDGNGTQTSEISEADRTSKYIMIAGGGGGGGAGDGPSIFGADPVGTADGGSGGSMTSASGQLTGDGYAVQGTYYVGADGKSSGTSTEYIGHGGTNVPGVLSQTITGLISSAQPNDWEGAANPDMEGGCGGSGNMRGGAGGAGYCGGSGSVMTSIVSAYNIGGGGGGSSFVASTVDSLTTADEAKLGQNSSSTGGAVNIVFLSGQDFSYLENLTLNVDLSQYMTVSSVTVSSGSWDGISAVTGMNLLTDTATVQITMQAAAGFAGGNNVPLFDAGLTCSTADSAYSTVLDLSDTCSFVNVPLSGFEVDVVNHTTNVQKDYTVSELHGTKWTDIDLSTWQYDFIESVNAYTVNGGDLKDTDTVNPSETTAYTVAITVNPKDTGFAVVGDEVTSTIFENTASIIFLKSTTDSLNGNSISYYKELTHDGENYILTLYTDVSSDLTASAAGEKCITPGNLNYSVLTTGYYYIQAWGGTGGNGGTNGGTGGNGAVGGYVSGYVKLEKDSTLTGIVAANGTNGNATYDNQTVSSGGGFSSVILNGTTLIIAGGGGGGGNGGKGALSWSNEAGDDGLSNSEIEVSDSPESNTDNYYKGKPGGEAQYIKYGIGYSCSTGGSGGAAGANFRSSTSIRIDPATDTSLTSLQQEKIAAAISGISTVKPTTATAGAVVITPLLLESSEQKDIADYSVNVQISDYFVLADVDSTEANISFDGIVTGTGHEIGYAYTSIESGGNNLLQISNIDPTVSETVETTTDSNGQISTQTVRDASFSVSIALKPREGFLGGNDVPVIEATADDPTGMSMQYEQYDELLEITEDPKTDFANVTIPADNAWANEELLVITEPPPSITADETAERTPDLYEWGGMDLALPGDWTDEFVERSVILTYQANGVEVEENPLAPDTTTKYIVSAGLAPTVTDPQAICLPAVDAAMCSKEGIIYVLPRIIYQLTNLETDDSTGIWDGSDYTVTVAADTVYTATLTPATGYALPDSITVLKSGSEVQSGYTYNASTGKITLDAELVGTKAVTIQATGGVAEYNINYYYEVSPGLATGVEIETYIEGADLTGAFHNTYIADTYDGYEFVWSWETDGGEVPTRMPAKNLWVIGTYVPQEYTLTIQYLEKDTETVLAPSGSQQVRYGSDYSVTPISVAGYNPEISVLTGTMDELGKTVTFYYTASTGQLNITYVYGDTNETYRTEQVAIATGGSYSVASPAISGYTPDLAEVSYNNVTAEQVASGINVTVTYTPNVYTVTFEPDGGNMAESSREVVFNRTYNYYRYYDTDTADYAYAYVALPVPIRTGYTFEGWYLNGSEVTESTAVTTAGDHTLIARWEGEKYALTVKYVYEDGTTAAETVTQQVEYDTEFSVVSPTIDGATPDVEVVSGTMPAVNRLYTVTYTYNSHTLTVRYLYGPDEGSLAGTQVFENDTMEVENNTTVNLIPPEKDGYNVSPTSMSVEMGTTDQTVTFYYSEAAPVVSVTVEWRQLEFEYDYGIWNPTSHTYSVEPIDPSSAGMNYVVVTNNEDSNVPVSASLSYEAEDGYESITAYFTGTNSRTGTVVTKSGTLDPSSEFKAYLWLQGTLERGQSGTIISGTCTVTITGGG